MKLLNIIIGLLISVNITGQQLNYKGSLVDTIRIVSHSSHYHFDDHGTTTGVYDEYFIVFNKEKNSYILSPHERTDFKITFEPRSTSKKEKTLKQGSVIDGLLISNLLKQFEIKYAKPTLSNLGMSNKEFLNLTDKKHLIQVAKWNNDDWHFKRRYSSKEQNEKIFKDCQNTDTLNLYLANAFDTSGYVMVTDVADLFRVQIVTTKNKYHFEGKYPNPFKQPWYDHSDTSRLFPTSILNLSINQALVSILPSNFSRLASLKFEALTNEYLLWYLKRRRIII